MTVFRADPWLRVNHDQSLDDPPGVEDVPPAVVVAAFVFVLPIACIWLAMTKAWRLCTQWR